MPSPTACAPAPCRERAWGRAGGTKVPPGEAALPGRACCGQRPWRSARALTSIAFWPQFRVASATCDLSCAWRRAARSAQAERARVLRACMLRAPARCRHTGAASCLLIRREALLEALHLARLAVVGRNRLVVQQPVQHARCDLVVGLCERAGGGASARGTWRRSQDGNPWSHFAAASRACGRMIAPAAPRRARALWGAGGRRPCSCPQGRRSGGAPGRWGGGLGVRLQHGALSFNSFCNLHDRFIRQEGGGGRGAGRCRS